MSGSTGGFGSDFMSALMDPGVNALLGAAQGFAQAAMPTRMPIPTGAALGMGAGGLAQGLGTGLGLQRTSMQNQVAASQLPLELAKNKMLSNFWQHPEQIQQMMGGGVATPFGAPAAGDVPMPAAATPVAPITGAGTPTASNPAIQPIIAAEAQKNGIPLPLAMAYLQQESSLGTNPAGKDNIGQITFKTANNPGYGMAPISGNDMRDPAKNIAFSLQYLRNAGDKAGVKDWNDPSQWGIGLQAYNGGGDPNYVQNVARWLPKSTMIPGGVTQGSFQVAQAGNGPVPVPGGAAQPQGQPAPAPQGGAPQLTGANAMMMAQQVPRRRPTRLSVSRLSPSGRRLRGCQRSRLRVILRHCDRLPRSSGRSRWLAQRPRPKRLRNFLMLAQPPPLSRKVSYQQR